MSLLALSPLDGRYHSKLELLSNYFSEYALIKYRIFVEVEYFIDVFETLPLSITLNEDQKRSLREMYQSFSVADAEKIKIIEETTKHDVKAIEYFLKEKISNLGLSEHKEIIHLGLTSQDINNTVYPIILMEFSKQALLPKLYSLTERIQQLGTQWKKVPMLARTHGQPASPTSVGKEFLVFAERLNKQLHQLSAFRYSGKFGGATGNFNAHRIAFPQIDWPAWANRFLLQKLNLDRQQYTTQIAHYDEIAEWYHILIRINTILIDLCRDLWLYISMDYFKQKIKENEIGSSAMPHKVNPIDFENAEGNYALSVAISSFFAEKLPISRLQRDLTDSTVLRNMGVATGHMYVAIESTLRGLNKLILNEERINEELSEQWIILAEAIQTVLRRENYSQPYEKLKELTRGKSQISKKELHQFIHTLDIDSTVKDILLKLDPFNYTGYSCD